MDRKAYLKQKNQERKQTHKRVELYLPKTKAKRFEKVAKKEGVSTNKLIEQFASAYLDENYIIPKPLKKRLDQHNFLVRNIANNINQIAHASNIFHEADKQAILKNLEDLNQLVYQLTQQDSKSWLLNRCHEKVALMGALPSSMITLPETMAVTRDLISLKILYVLIGQPSYKNLLAMLASCLNEKMATTSTMKSCHSREANNSAKMSN